jgi:hypothetical protein
VLYVNQFILRFAPNCTLGTHIHIIYTYIFDAAVVQFSFIQFHLPLLEPTTTADGFPTRMMPHWTKRENDVVHDGPTKSISTPTTTPTILPKHPYRRYNNNNNKIIRTVPPRTELMLQLHNSHNNSDRMTLSTTAAPAAAGSRTKLRRMTGALMVGSTIFWYFFYMLQTTRIIRNISTSSTTTLLRHHYLDGTTETNDYYHRQSDIGTYAKKHHRTESLLSPNDLVATDKERQQQQQHRSFPKWGATAAEEDAIGFSLEPLFDFLFNSSIYNTGRKNGRYRPILDRYWISSPETLYMIEPGGHLFTSNLHRNLQQVQRFKKIEKKLNNTERLMLHALQIIQEEQTQQRLLQNEEISTCTNSRWPALCRSLFSNDGYGFPFLSWYGDYMGCNYHNWISYDDQEVSIPLFTVAANVHCNYTFPFPNYYSHLMPTPEHWTPVMQSYRQQYAWDTKIPMVGWRGGISGTIYNATTKCSRWNMVQTVRQIEAQRRHTHPSPVRASLFDVVITDVPPGASPFRSELEADVGHIDETVHAMQFLDFQKYRAILDVDGNSWSGRFGSLMCFNSIILKVEPTYVDYFYYKYTNPNISTHHHHHRHDPSPPTSRYTTTLQPWIHYIPIREDFSDLEQHAEFVLDPQNEDIVLEIVQNANEWCRYNMIDTSFAADMLNVWDRYVQLLNTHNPHWDTDTWQSTKLKLLDTTSPWDMIQLSYRDYPRANAFVDMIPTAAL